MTELSHKSERPRAMDLITMGYLAWLSLALLLGMNRPSRWPVYLGANVVAAGLLLVAGRMRRRLPTIPRVVYHWYPIWGIAPLYEELRHLIQLLVPKWFDRFFLSADVRLFGSFPCALMERFYWKPLNELMMIGYFSYYFIPSILCVPLYCRSDKRAFHQTAAAIFLATLSCFVMFLLLPTQGPRQFYAHFRTVPIEGYLITRIEHTLISFGGLLGAAFPSSHCAVAMAALIQAWRHHRKIFYLFLLLVPLLSFSTIYGWYHYVVDVFAGWAVGIAAAWLAGKLYPCVDLRTGTTEMKVPQKC